MPLGQVVEVGIRYDPARKSFEIPVIIQIRPDVIEKYSPPSTLYPAGLGQLFDQGLRAARECQPCDPVRRWSSSISIPGTPVKLTKTDLPYYDASCGRLD